MSDHNEHECRARGRKAFFLAKSLWDHGMRNPAGIDYLTPDLRAAVEYDAGVRQPVSSECWSYCRGILAAMAEVEEQAGEEAVA